MAGTGQSPAAPAAGSAPDGPQTTGALAAAVTSVSRFAVMQHLAVLSDVGLVVVRPQGRRRLNYLNPVPLQRFHERWVSRIAATSATELLALERAVDEKGAPMATTQPTLTSCARSAWRRSCASAPRRSASSR